MMKRDSELQKLSRELSRDDISLTKLADGTAVLLDLERRQVLSLNATGCYVVDRLLAGTDVSAEALLEDFQQAYSLDSAVAERDLSSFLDELYRFVFAA